MIVNNQPKNDGRCANQPIPIPFSCEDNWSYTAPQGKYSSVKNSLHAGTCAVSASLVVRIRSVETSCISLTWSTGAHAARLDEWALSGAGEHDSTAAITNVLGSGYGARERGKPDLSRNPSATRPCPIRLLPLVVEASTPPLLHDLSWAFPQLNRLFKNPSFQFRHILCLLVHAFPPLISLLSPLLLVLFFNFHPGGRSSPLLRTFHMPPDSLPHGVPSGPPHQSLSHRLETAPRSSPPFFRLWW